MNKFQFMGRLTREPEAKFTTNNKPVTTFSIAVNRRFADQNGERKADFFNITAYGKLAEFCSKYYKKGQQVLVEGRIQNRTWEDQNGQKRYATDYIVENVYFADSSKNIKENPNGYADDDGEFVTIDDDEELPF